MKGSTLMIGLVFFAVITSGLWFFVSDLADNYDVTVNSTYMDQFNKINDLENQFAEPMLNKTAGSTGVEEGTNAVKISSGVYGAIKYIFRMPSFLVGITNNVASMLGIPGWFVTAFTVIISILIIFYVISAVFGRDL